MVFDGVVEQRGACYVGVGDAVVGDDPDGDPEQVVGIRFTLPPVLGVIACSGMLATNRLSVASSLVAASDASFAVSSVTTVASV
jgi:hypothetical protein